MYYVGFSTATIVASVILFQGFNTDDPANSISLLAGFITTFLGVHLLEISRKPDPSSIPGGHPHSALEAGLMNPRLSIHGRMSIDGWSGAAGTPIGSTMPTPWSAGPASGHGRRSSLYRHQTQTLFQAFEEDEDERGADGLGLDTLREVEDDELEADERTALRSGRRFGNGNGNGNGNGSRSHSGSNTPRETRSPRI
uniref:C3H1-type domain-containing protein n=1 Tax=Ganoderma boninense TaxID=34458 RepID=A0A5K1K3D6_9APHY|nr:C3H1-type domain-containing protein [Ganoderma boninense]